MAISNASIRRRGGDLFHDLLSRGDDPVKIVPICFPIAEETYEVIQVVTEPIGMVERYVVEAICKFGPCSADKIARLLSLDPDLVSEVIQRLVDADADIIPEDRRFSAGRSLRDANRDGRLAKRVRHQRSFIVNPLTGDLLPIDFLDRNSRWMVPVVPENDESNPKDWLRCRIGDRASGAEQALVEALLSTDTEVRRSLGIPEGGVSLTDDFCHDRKLYSLVAFAVIARTLTVKVVSAIDISTPLSDTDTSDLAYWDRISHGVGPWVFAEPAPIDGTVEHLQRSLDGVECRSTDPDTVAVSIQNPDDALFVDNRNAGSGSDPMNRLQMDLINGWYWNVYDFRIVRLIAGDAATEERLMILRGVHQLRDLFRSRTPSSSLTLVDWWEDIKSDFPIKFCNRENILSIDLDTLLAEAERVPDTKFLDWLDDASSFVEARGG